MKNIDQEKHYFSQTGLQNLKRDINLVFAIGAEIQLMKKGQRFFANCPLHGDTNQSLVISSKKNLWYCFGDCKKGGSIVDWVMAYERLKLVDALAVLAERYPFLAQKGQVGKQELNKEVPEQCDLLRHKAILLQIVEYYQTCLAKQSRAIRYLRSQGINQTVAKKHKIGFCDGSLSEMLKQRTGDDELLKKELQELGLLQIDSSNTFIETFVQQIVYPVFNEQGQGVQLFGRELPSKIKIARVRNHVPSLQELVAS